MTEQEIDRIEATAIEYDETSVTIYNSEFEALLEAARENAALRKAAPDTEGGESDG